MRPDYSLDRRPEDKVWGHAYGPGADGVNLHYVRRGRGEPVVLLHGWPGFWYDWRRVVFPLAEEADVIAPDFRGFGDSDKPEGDPKAVYVPDRLAADVLALLDHLGIERFVVAGHDTGAVIAQVLARRVPERVRALALFNTPHAAIGDKPQEEPGAQRDSWYHHFHALPWSHELFGYDRDTTRLYLRHFYDHWVGNKESVRPKEFEAIVDTFARPGALGASFGWYRATYEEETEPSSRQPEGPIPIPAVVRWGELDPVKPTSWAEGIEQTFPNLDFRFVPGAGHFVPFEAPEETVAAIVTALSLARLDDLRGNRALRLLEAREGLPRIVWFVLIAGGVITIAFTYLFGMRSLRLHALAVAALTVVLTLVLFTIGALEYPFGGSVRVAPEAFELVLREVS